MEIRIRVADPAGNITIFVMDPLKRSQYADVATQLLLMKEFEAEQVGYVEENVDKSLHMQMMGGEFCGNATRSFGYLKSILDETHPELVEADVSGADHLLLVEIDHKAGRCRTQMPLPKEIVKIEVPEYGTYDMVVFDGISHVIIEEAPKGEDFTHAVFKVLEEQYEADAYGIMFLENDKMTPVVYVVETASIVWESSCGSGSMGSAVYLSKDKPDGTYAYELKQPGGIIEATVEKKDGKVTVCKMGGPVTISEEKVVEITV